MSLVNSNAILADARRRKYGIPSLLAGNQEMIVGFISAAEALNAPLILAFNQEVTPTVPIEIGMALAVDAARKASVPVATILDHGADIEQIVAAIRYGTSSVMFDGSHLQYEENVQRTREIVRIAHAAGVDVEAELGGISGSSVNLTDAGPEAAMTDPKQAADFVAHTGVDVLAISFGNAHGVYRGEPHLDLKLVQTIRDCVDIPLAMHGASGLTSAAYPPIIASGISKICYYTAMARAASQDIYHMLDQSDFQSIIYHQIITRATGFFSEAAKELLHLLDATDKAMN